MNIALDGRKLIDSKIEQLAEQTSTINTYDDGTIIKFVQTGENIDVQCNKALVVQPDGKTIKIY